MSLYLYSYQSHIKPNIANSQHHPTIKRRKDKKERWKFGGKLMKERHGGPTCMQRVWDEVWGECVFGGLKFSLFQLKWSGVG